MMLLNSHLTPSVNGLTPLNFPSSLVTNLSIASMELCHNALKHNLIQLLHLNKHTHVIIRCPWFSYSQKQPTINQSFVLPSTIAYQLFYHTHHIIHTRLNHLLYLSLYKPAYYSTSQICHERHHFHLNGGTYLSILSPRPILFRLLQDGCIWGTYRN